MNTSDDKNKKFPTPWGGAYANNEESGDFGKVDDDETMFDKMSDKEGVNYNDAPPSPVPTGDENYDDEQARRRSRKDYRDEGMIEETNE